jgi:branched-chain amino acid transport system permease protein
MELLSQVVLSGLTVGSLYALVGLGFVIIFKSTGVLNFAHGEMLMLGAMIALYLHMDLTLAFLPAIAVAVIVTSMFGALVERIAFRPLRMAPVITVILATVAVGQMIRSAVRIIRGPEVSRFPSLFPTEPFSFMGVTMTPMSLGIIIVSVLLVIGFVLFFHKTKLGKGMQATSENREAAMLVGISVNQTFSLIWAIGAALAAAAGILLAPLIIITPDMGLIGIKGFIGAVLGGFLSIPGAVTGGFLLGVIENLAGVYIESSMKDAVSFAVLVLVLWLRPSGLFARSGAARV